MPSQTVVVCLVHKSNVDVNSGQIVVVVTQHHCRFYNHDGHHCARGDHHHKGDIEKIVHTPDNGSQQDQNSDPRNNKTRGDSHEHNWSLIISNMAMAKFEKKGTFRMEVIWSVQMGVLVNVSVPTVVFVVVVASCPCFESSLSLAQSSWHRYAKALLFCSMMLPWFCQCL